MHLTPSRGPSARRRFVGWLCALGLLVAAPSARGQQSADVPLRTAGDRPFDVRHIRLDLRVDLEHRTVEGRATLQVRSLRPLAELALDAEEFEVRAVRLGGGDGDDAPAPYAHDGHRLLIDLDPAWPAGRDAVVRVEYRVRDPRDGLHFFGPTEAHPETPRMVWSQGEATYNRFWFPCLDQPDQRQTTELVVTVADGLEVLSNGRLVERRSNPDDHTVTFHWRLDRPHPSYLITLVVGRFEVVRDEGPGVPVFFYVPPGRRDEVAPTFGKTRAMIDLFSRLFGIDYPWDKYAQVVVEQFTAGGMENTSATTMNDRVLHDRRGLLDSSPDSIVAHELAHQWWGDMVTCRDWGHLWLNEGFASYMEAVWAEHDQGADEYAYAMWQKGRSAVSGGKDRPVVDRRYPAIWTMFDARSYPKGAFILHMLRQRLGDDVFWACLRRHGTEHRFQSVETGDFRKTLEQETGRSLERFFYDWTERPGCPVLDVATEYLPDSRLARVAVKQTQAGEAFQFPLTVLFRCGGAGGKEVAETVEVTDKEQTLYVPLPGRPTLVEIDPRQAVLADLHETKGRELWLAQLRQGGVAARLRAAQHFGQSKLPPDREVLAQALAAEPFWGVRTEVAAALGESGGDTCRDALLAGLRQEDARVRRACVQQLARFRRDARVAAALKELLGGDDPSRGVQAAALTAYGRLGPKDAVAVLLPWLAKASHNDELRLAALAGLGEARDLEALDTLLAWTRRGKPAACRSAALAALARLAQTATPSEKQQQQIVEAGSACLEGETRPVRRAAVSLLQDMGRAATAAVPALETLSRHDPEDSVRDQARQAVERIRTNQPVPGELSRLREDVERLRQSQEQLQDRLNKFEKVEQKGK